MKRTLALSTIIAAIFLFTSPLLAQSSTELLRERIAELEEQLLKLQSLVAQFSDQTLQTSASDLKIGSVGLDVLELQRFLNQSEDTLVALTGPGSRGNETIYYGERTANAVKRFQQKNLLPLTGVVDATTRSRIERGTILTLNEREIERDENAEVVDGGALGEIRMRELNPIDKSLLEDRTLTADDVRVIAQELNKLAPEGYGTFGMGGNGNGGLGPIAQLSLFPEFGGKITRVHYCTCTPGIALTITSPTGGIKQLMYIPIISSLYRYYNVFIPGSNSLGTYFPYSLPCTQGFGIGGLGACLPDATVQPTGTVRLIGTSLPTLF